MGNAMKLIEPDLRYEDEFKNFVLEYKRVGEISYFDMYKKALENFELFVTELQNQSKGFDLPEGWVPCSTYWV